MLQILARDFWIQDCNNPNDVGLAWTLDAESDHALIQVLRPKGMGFAGLSTGSEAVACYEVPNSRTVASCSILCSLPSRKRTSTLRPHDRNHAHRQPCVRSITPRSKHHHGDETTRKHPDTEKDGMPQGILQTGGGVNKKLPIERNFFRNAVLNTTLKPAFFKPPQKPPPCSKPPQTQANHALTKVGARRPASTASILSSASIPIAVRVSTVALPRCGSRNTFFSSRYPG